MPESKKDQKSIEHTSDTEIRFVIIMFLYYLSLNIFSIFKLHETALGGLLQLWNIVGLLVLLLASFHVTKFKTIASKYIPLFVLFFVSNLATAWFVLTGNTGSSTLSNPSQILPSVFMFLFLVLLGRQTLSPVATKKFNNLIIIFAVFTCIYNLVANISTINQDLVNMNETYDLLLSAFYSNRNTFGFFLGTALAILSLNYTTEQSSKIRFAYTLIFILLISNLILTMSRGAMLTVIIYFIVFMVLRKGLYGILRLILAFAVIVLVTYSMLGANFVNDNLIRAEAGTTGREALQDYGISYFKENNMIVGSGVELPSQSLDAKYNFRSFHSTYITILAEGGFLLMTAYTAIILATFSNMVRLFKKNREYGAFFIALLIAYLAYSLVESNILLRFDNNSFLITAYLVFIPAYLVNYYTRNAKLESLG